MTKIMTIGAAVMVALFSLVIVLHGKARYSAGYAECIAAQSEAEEKALIDAKKELEKIQDETARLSDASIDADLSRLGIMRADEDR